MLEGGDIYRRVVTLWEGVHMWDGCDIYRRVPTLMEGIYGGEVIS